MAEVSPEIDKFVELYKLYTREKVYHLLNTLFEDESFKRKFASAMKCSNQIRFYITNSKVNKFDLELVAFHPKYRAWIFKDFKKEVGIFGKENEDKIALHTFVEGLNFLYYGHILNFAFMTHALPEETIKRAIAELSQHMKPENIIKPEMSLPPLIVAPNIRRIHAESTRDAILQILNDVYGCQITKEISISGEKYYTAKCFGYEYKIYIDSDYDYIVVIKKIK